MQPPLSFLTFTPQQNRCSKLLPPINNLGRRKVFTTHTHWRMQTQKKSHKKRPAITFYPAVLTDFDEAKQRSNHSQFAIMQLFKIFPLKNNGTKFFHTTPKNDKAKRGNK